MSDNLLSQISSINGKLFHCTLIRTEREEGIKDLNEALRGFCGVELYGNPDVFMVSNDLLGVDEAREATDFLSRKSFAEDGLKFVVLAADEISHEAQNALLKSAEEPPEGSVIFVLVPPMAHILPTLLSRALVVEHLKDQDDKEAEKFLAATMPERQAKAAALAKKKDIRRIKSFVFALERAAHGIGEEGKRHMAYEAILHAEKELAMRGAQGKSVLDYLSVALPLMSK